MSSSLVCVCVCVCVCVFLFFFACLNEFYEHSMCFTGRTYSYIILSVDM